MPFFDNTKTKQSNLSFNLFLFCILRHGVDQNTTKRDKSLSGLEKDTIGSNGRILDDIDSVLKQEFE